MTIGKTPQFGWPVPQDDEFVRLGADAMRTLAGQMELSFQGGNNVWCATHVSAVTFTRPFASTPWVVAVNADPDHWSGHIGVMGVTTTGFSVKAMTSNTQVFNGPYRIHYIAIGAVA